MKLVNILNRLSNNFTDKHYNPGGLYQLGRETIIKLAKAGRIDDLVRRAGNKRKEIIRKEIDTASESLCHDYSSAEEYWIVIENLAEAAAITGPDNLPNVRLPAQQKAFEPGILRSYYYLIKWSEKVHAKAMVKTP